MYTGADVFPSLYAHGKLVKMHAHNHPVGIWCQNDVVSTSMRRNHVASTLIRRHFCTKCPLGQLSWVYYRCKKP